MEIYQIIIFWLLAWLVVSTLVNVWMFPTAQLSRGVEPARGSDVPKVSVLVPARNEEHNIGACAGSLMAQDDPNFEVLVLDDRSEDNTYAVLSELGFVDAGKDPRAQFRVMAGTPLPDGWAGKPWACDQLARAARGDWLLFTDADTIHTKSSIRAAVESAERERAGLYSAWPRQITGSWAERAVIPLLYLLTITLLPQILVQLLLRWPRLAALAGPRAVSGLGAANGQYMLFRREVYERIGGHAAVADHLVEDVALARLVMAGTAHGDRLVNADGSRIVSCRMYRNAPEVWEGFSKNLRPAFGANIVAFIGSGVVQVAVFVAPLVFALLPLPGQHWAICQVVLLLAIRVILTLRFNSGWRSILWHPVGYLFALVIALNSWRWALKGAIQWKGRIYRG